METADPPVIRGLALRSLLVLILLRRGAPSTVGQLAAEVETAGFALAGRPGKTVSDALRWEMGRGRARRVEAGLYGPGYVAKVTRHRMKLRVAETRNRGGTPAYANRPKGTAKTMTLSR